MIKIPMKESKSISLERYAKDVESSVETFHNCGKSRGKYGELSTPQKIPCPENVDFTAKTACGKLVEHATTDVETFHQHGESSTSIKILQKGQRQKLQSKELQLHFSSLISDISIFLIDESNKVLNDDWFLYYNQSLSPDHSVQFMEDNVINVNLNKLNTSIQKMVFTLTSDSTTISNMKLTLTSSNEAFSMDIDGGQSQSMIACEIYYKNNEWRFYAANQLTEETLYDFCMQYGVQVSD